MQDTVKAAIEERNPTDRALLENLRVAIVVVNFNGWRECVECIDSIFAQSHHNFHLFIVDNASTDDSIEHIAAWLSAPRADPAWRRQPGVRRLTDEPSASPRRCRIIEQAAPAAAPEPDCRITIVRSRDNLGFAGGCNLGIAAAGLESFDYVWLLNPDTTLDENALVELLRRARETPAVDMVGSTMRYYDRPDVVEAMGGAWLDRADGSTRHIGQGESIAMVPTQGLEVERTMAYVMGASMLVSREFIAEVGPMQEDYFLYYEEVDWALRAQGRFALGYAPRSHVYHKSGAISGKARPFSTGFYYRNRLRFVARFFPDKIAAAKWSIFRDLLRQIARAQWPYARITMRTLLQARRITADVRLEGGREGGRLKAPKVESHA